MLLEYRLDLEGNLKYLYVGSGTVNVFGTAGTNIVEAYGVFDVFFEDKEWVYTLDHNIRQVVSLNNSPTVPVWTTVGEGTVQADFSEQLIKFEQGPAFFTAKYTAIVDYYENLLTQVNAKIDSMTPYSMKPNMPLNMRKSSATVKTNLQSTPETKKKPEETIDIETLAKSLDFIRANINKMGKNANLHR